MHAGIDLIYPVHQVAKLSPAEFGAQYSLMRRLSSPSGYRQQVRLMSYRYFSS